MLHSKRVELLEHAEHHANPNRVCEDFPREGKGVLLFFARIAVQDVISKCEHCCHHIRKCQKGDVRSRNLGGFCFAKQFDNARANRGAHHCGKREKEPTSSLFFFFLLDVENHRKDKE